MDLVDILSIIYPGSTFYHFSRPQLINALQVEELGSRLADIWCPFHVVDYFGHVMEWGRVFPRVEGKELVDHVGDAVT